ncbi:MAG: hypothetical protein KatS3mg099_277 [Candidatus Parcubacteria bacterium]|nr:MAG: hypothetical protein KatS3mg099_277 [Candidatus Parcubacteria bacterium]
MTMRYEEHPAFQKELKRLRKRYRTLPKDLEILKLVLNTHPNGTSSKHFAALTQRNGVFIGKVRLACRSLAGKRRLRVIYAYHETEQRIVFLELYFKGDKVAEDKARIRTYLKDNS